MTFTIKYKLLRVAWKISVEQLKVIYNVSSWKELFLLKVVDHFETEDFPEDEDLFEYEDIFEDIERNPDFVASRIMPQQSSEGELGIQSIDEAWTDFRNSLVDRERAKQFCEQ